MADLALQYLERLAENPPPEVAPVLLLELAKTRLDVAVNDPDQRRRTALQDQAQAEFRLFIQNNAKHPLAAEASLEIARISAWRGTLQLNRAQRTEAGEARRAELRKARQQFEEADKELLAAWTQIGAQIVSLSSASEGEADVASLKQARLQAELE